MKMCFAPLESFAKTIGISRIRVIESSCLPRSSSTHPTSDGGVLLWWGSLTAPPEPSQSEVSRTALSEGAPHLRSINCEGRLSRRARILPASFYILRLQSTHLYCGSTRSLEKRIKDHFAGRACRTTRIDPPIALVYSEEYPSYKEAFRREHQVKRWSRAKKEALVAGDMDRLKKPAKRKGA
jgi:putative endonuclease